MRRGVGPAALLLAGGLCLLPGDAVFAQEGVLSGLQKGVEGVFTSVSTTTTFATGAVTKTDTQSFSPSLHLNLDTLIYPSLRLNAGGIWEYDMFSTAGLLGETRSTISKSRPFVLLRSTDPVFSPGIAYFRREEQSRANGQSDITLVNEEYAGYLSWNPAGGPQSNFQFLKTHRFDDARAYENTTQEFGSLTSTYTRRNLGVRYLGSYLDSDDELERFKTRQVSHSGRVDASVSLFRERLRWNASYNVGYRDFRTSAAGSGEEIALPLTPSEGLAALSDTPVTAKLAPNEMLIDEDLAAAAGIDLGLPSSPSDAQARNIGLNFLSPAEVSRLLVWVDRDLPAEIAASFAWEVYSSEDNVLWTRQAAVPSAPFGPFELRFEIDFAAVTARYLKVVTRPLSAVVPGASRFPDIFVTELQAFTRNPAQPGDNRLAQTTHLLNTDVRLRLLETPSLSYEGYYLYNGTGGSVGGTDTLSNGLSLNQAFGRLLSVYARGAREQGTQPQGYTVANVADASVTVEPIPTFRSSMLYTGRREAVSGSEISRQGVYIQNSGQVYRGVDVQFGIGWNSSTRASGQADDSRLLNFSTTIVPRQQASFTLSYDDTKTEQTGTVVDQPMSRLQRTYASVSLSPTRSLQLVVGGEVLAATGEKTRATLSFGANWAPFPDGTLQFVFAYNESRRDLVFGTELSTLGAVRWNVSRRSYVDVSFQRTESEFVLFKTESRILGVTVRMFF